MRFTSMDRPTLCAASVAPITATFLGLKKTSSVRRCAAFRIRSLSIQFLSGIDQLISCANGPGEIRAAAREAGDEPLVVTESGKPVAVVVSIEGPDAESLSLSANPKFLSIIARSRAQQAAGLELSDEEMRQQLGIA